LQDPLVAGILPNRSTGIGGIFASVGREHRSSADRVISRLYDGAGPSGQEQLNR